MQLCHTLSVCYLIVSLCVPYVMTKSVAALPLPLPPCVFVIHGIAICVVHWPIFRWRHCPPPFPSNNSYIVSVHLNRSYGRESRIYRVSSLFPEFRMNINISTLCHICGHVWIAHFDFRSQIRLDHWRMRDQPNFKLFVIIVKEWFVQIFTIPLCVRKNKSNEELKCHDVAHIRSRTCYTRKEKRRGQKTSNRRSLY